MTYKKCNPILTMAERIELDMRDTYVSAPSPDRFTIVDDIIFFDGQRIAFLTQQDYEECKRSILEKRHIN